ncbi:MAG: glycosyltransferase family 39 protein [Anaerolineae bacterium]|nr:glycosyltransferase family 39 protein [Anaerolineae bacterium]
MIAILITLLMLVSTYPLVRLLLGNRRDPVLTWTTTLALSVGLVSLLMLWQGLLGILIDWRIAAITAALISLLGWMIWLPRRQQSANVAPPLNRYEIGALGIIAVIAVLILFNATYWPPAIDDAITIYAAFGKQIYHTQTLPQGTLYETYPMLVPLWYAFVHQVAGQLNEYLAGLIPALLSLGCIGAAYLIGRELQDRRTGLIAALLVAITPPFAHWSSTGYVDLPAGFFYALTVLFLFRWQRDNRPQDALLGGIMAGLALWTKNNTVVLPIIILLWLVYVSLRRKSLPSIRDLLLIFGGIAVTAGAWYAHTLIMAGVLLPPTAWTDQAQREITSLFPYLSFGQYSLAGAIFTPGLLYALWRLLRRKLADRAVIHLLIFYVPFFAAWWLLASYDPRFLLLLTPLIAVLAALLIADLWSNRVIQAVFVIAVVVLSAQSAYIAVDHKTELLRSPILSDAEKHRIRVGVRYDMAQYINTLPPARLLTTDILLPYYLDSMTALTGELPATADQLIGVEYVVLRPQDDPLWLADDSPAFEIGGYRLYRLPSR